MTMLMMMMMMVGGIVYSYYVYKLNQAFFRSLSLSPKKNLEKKVYKYISSIYK